MRKFLFFTALATLITGTADAKLFSLSLSQDALSEARSYDSITDLFDDVCVIDMQNHTVTVR